MDVVTGEFKDLSSCQLLSLSRDGRSALLCGRRTYGLISICDNLQLETKVARKKSTDDVNDIKFSR